MNVTIYEELRFLIYVGCETCSSVGYSLLCKKEKTITVQPGRVVIGNGAAFGSVLMKDFLEALSKRVKRNSTAYDNYLRMYVPSGVPLKQKANEPLKTVNLFKHIQVLSLQPLSIKSQFRYIHGRKFITVLVFKALYS